MKKLLTRFDVAKGNRYKVVRRPEHLKGVAYPWINMIGVCKWVSGNEANMSFGECKERLVPVSCLELVEEIPTQMSEKPSLDEPSANDALVLFYANKADEDAKEKEKLIEQARQREKEYEDLTPKSIKLDNLYRIARVPHWWTENSASMPYPSLGAIGRCTKINPKSVLLKMGNGQQRYVPFSSLEQVNIIVPPPPVMDLADDKLIDIILANPRGCLKILKGLAKMNKDPRAVTFVQRGMLL